MTLCASMVSQILPHNKESAGWVGPLSDTLPEYDITSNKRIAAFIAQTAYESVDYTRLEEDLSYSRKRILEVFKKYFPDQGLAAEYERSPEKLANRVYANRLGNGNEASGDGWKYRGRGIIQLTGKSNYAEASIAFYGDDELINYPDLLVEDKFLAVESACFFWKSRGLNNLADKENMVEITRRINGGREGLEERWRMYREILGALAN